MNLHGASLGFDREFFESLVLPSITSELVIDSVGKLAKRNQSNERIIKKNETDDLLVNFRGIAIAAHKRLNVFDRFHEAAIQAQNHAIKNKLLVFSYSYMEGNTLVQCKIEHKNFILEQMGSYKVSNFSAYCGREVKDFIASTKYEPEEYVVNICNHKEVSSNIWFIELASANAFYPATAATKAPLELFLVGNNYPSTYFFSHYLFRSLFSGLPMNFLCIASEALGTVYISHHELQIVFYLAAFATEFMITTGARLNEVLQIALHEDVLKILTIPNLSNALADSERYALLLIPKGADVQATYFISKKTFELLHRVSLVLSNYYRVFYNNEIIPSLEPNKSNKKRHLMQVRPYIFQIGRHQLNGNSLMTAVKFLLHNAVFSSRTENGRIVTVKIKSHVLRHAFSTYAVQIEKTPIDVVAKILNQKHLPTTEYYSEPTLSIISDHHDSLANSIIHSANLDEEAARSPEHLQLLYKEAKSRSGTMTEVLGGTCVAHGYCPAKTSCIGCAGKVPDPQKKNVIISKLRWAENEKKWNHSLGHTAEERKMDVLIQSCEIELNEIAEIERYEQERAEPVQIFDSSNIPLKWVDGGANK